MADSDMSGPLSAVASVSVYYFVRHRAWKLLSARILIGCHSIILLVRILLKMVKSATRWSEGIGFRFFVFWLPPLCLCRETSRSSLSTTCAPFHSCDEFCSFVRSRVSVVSIQDMRFGALPRHWICWNWGGFDYVVARVAVGQIERPYTFKAKHGLWEFGASLWPGSSPGDFIAWFANEDHLNSG